MIAIINKFRQIPISKRLVIILILLCFLGTMNIFSSGSIQSLNDYNTAFHFVIKQGMFLFLGIGACIFFIYFNNDFYKNKYFIIFIFCTILFLLLAVKFFGITNNNSRRWLDIGITTIQPSEMAKGAAMIMGAYGAYQIHRTNYQISFRNFKKDFWGYVQKMLPLLGLGIFFVLVEIQPDFGTAAIILGVGIIQYIVGAKMGLWKTIINGIIVGTPLIALYIMYSFEHIAYRFKRIAAWYDPWSDPLGTGYQTVQSIIAIGSGGIFGMGYGDGLSKFGSLPEAHTDFAVAIFAQEYGLIGIAVLSILILALLITLTEAAQKCKDYLGKILIVGGIVLIVGQALFNMAMVVGLLPVVGVPFPFVSFGGTSLITNFAIFGIILNRVLEEENRNKPKKKFIPQRRNVKV